jgi:DNA-binding beta-propeller fold protein YncE
MVPYGIAVDPMGKFVYVANQRGSNVSAYTINPSTGALAAVSGSPFAAGSTAEGVAVDPMGKFLYVANFDDAIITSLLSPSTRAPGGLQR